MFDLFGKKKEEAPYVYDITVPEILKKSLGFKTRLSSFYLITDKERQQAETPHKDLILKYLSQNKNFRGIYCSSAVEQISDIRSDLKKYCDLTGCVGFVRLNGQDEKINPVRQLPVIQKQR